MQIVIGLLVPIILSTIGAWAYERNSVDKELQQEVSNLKVKITRLEVRVDTKLDAILEKQYDLDDLKKLRAKIQLLEEKTQWIDKR